jgi:hypothetical protein
MAELGCYWARVGEFEKAEELRSDLRRFFGDGRSVRVSILIMCIEALIAYFRELNPQARDRMARAALLSTAARDSNLIALTSAWMAHIDFNLNRFESMASAIGSCLSHLGSNDASTECRISLVLGDAFLFAGATNCSNIWYQRARAAAGMAGDQAAIGAFTYNRAALHVSAARFKHLLHPLPASDINLLNVEVQSAINYQAIAQLKSLDHLLQSALVGVMILQGRFLEALPVITTVLDSPDVPQNSAQRTLLQADLSFSRASLGLTDGTPHTDALQSQLIDSFTPDDRALIWSSMLRARKICGDLRNMFDYEGKIEMAISEHNGNIDRLCVLLSPFELQSPQQ